MSLTKYRVLIVDVSSSMRVLIGHILGADPEIEVIGAIPDINLARSRIPMMQLDVISFNAAMAGWDSAAALCELIRAHRVPIVVLGSRTHPEWASRYAILDPHYVQYLQFPGTAHGADSDTSVIVASLKSAARRGRIERLAASAGSRDTAGETPPSPSAGAYTREIIAIGASTGGPQAIAEILKSFPEDAPATLIVQHMPPGFTSTFARHLDKNVAIEVKEAAEGDEVRSGRALIAPAGHHMKIVRRCGRLHASILDTDPVNRHRPSVDVLFDSVTEAGGNTAVAALLSGMGNDGAAGMRRMHDSGALTVAQDEATCVVFGMPREAIKLDAVDSVLPIEKIGPELIALARK